MVPSRASRSIVVAETPNAWASACLVRRGGSSRRRAQAGSNALRDEVHEGVEERGEGAKRIGGLTSIQYTDEPSSGSGRGRFARMGRSVWERLRDPYPGDLCWGLGGTQFLVLRLEPPAQAYCVDRFGWRRLLNRSSLEATERLSIEAGEAFERCCISKPLGEPPWDQLLSLVEPERNPQTHTLLCSLLAMSVMGS